MADFNDSITKLQAVLTGLLTSVLLPILPVITTFFEAVSDGNPVVTFLISSLSMLVALRLVVWFASVTMAVRGFTLALMANPIDAVAVAISLAASALITLYRWFNKSTSAAKESNEVLQQTKKVSTELHQLQQKQMQQLVQNNELQSQKK